MTTKRAKPRRSTRASSAASPNDSAAANVAAAEAVSLRYTSDEEPGFQRLRRGKGFYFINPEGKVVRKASLLARFQALVLPPAWTDVWICTSASGHLQATGKDQRGRKQYRYHDRWRRVRDEAKFENLIEFAAALPKLRRRVTRDLAQRGMTRERVLAIIVRLLETTLIRVGNEEYARDNGSYGLTTMRDRHVNVRGDIARFQFRGKSGKTHDIELHDPRMARMLRKCQELPGRQLFEYRDEAGKIHRVTSTDVNDYLQEVTGEAFTAKDFRTWSGTLLALEVLARHPKQEQRTAVPKLIVEAVKQVAERLGNTPAVCRKSYIHPAILEAFADGALPYFGGHGSSRRSHSDLSTAERRLLRFLKRSAKPTRSRARAG
ncbi:MAG: DNA topoisomerase I [Pirellula sp.]|nr:DNA topoisomerase I [Pirellula sp.]